jgi:hypothetical protein
MRCRSESSTSRWRGCAQLGLRRLQLVVTFLQVMGLALSPLQQPGGVLEQRAVLQRGGGLAGQDAQHRAVRVVDLAVCGGPGDEPADDPSVEPDGDVHVPAVRLRVVRGVRRAGDDRGEVPAHEFGYGQRIGPLRPVRPAHEVAGAGLDELAVGQGEHDPVGR